MRVRVNTINKSEHCWSLTFNINCLVLIRTVSICCACNLDISFMSFILVSSFLIGIFTLLCGLECVRGIIDGGRVRQLRHPALLRPVIYWVIEESF